MYSSGFQKTPRIHCRLCKVTTSIADKYEAQRTHIYLYHPPENGLSIATQQAYLAKKIAACFPSAKILNDVMVGWSGVFWDSSDYYLLPFSVPDARLLSRREVHQPDCVRRA